MNAGGDLKGDGYQNGGTLVVAAGGKVLFSYLQEDPADHADPQDILKALGIQANLTESAGASAGAAAGDKKVVCEEDVCRKA